MDWFLNDRDLRHERVKISWVGYLSVKNISERMWKRKYLQPVIDPFVFLNIAM